MTEKESVTQRKIFEVRRKISLCEGKRRAVYNKGEVQSTYVCKIPLHKFPLVDKEKKKNKEDTSQIGEEVKVNHNHSYLKQGLYPPMISS